MNNTTTQDVAHKLPRKGETFYFESQGNRLRVRRNRGDNDWNAKIDGREQVRFGNATEIRSDIAYFLECGALPTPGRRTW